MPRDLPELPFGLRRATGAFHDVGGHVPDAEGLGASDVLARSDPPEHPERLIEARWAGGGDATYGKRANQHLREQTGYTAPRQMLHARQLAFTHPRTGEEKIFEAPWPADFREALERLKE